MKSKGYQLWVLVSFLEDFPGRGQPMFVSADTKSSRYGGPIPMFVPAVRDAKQFRSNANAHRFLKGIDGFNIYPLNVGAFGFVE